MGRLQITQFDRLNSVAMIHTPLSFAETGGRGPLDCLVESVRPEESDTNAITHAGSPTVQYGLTIDR